MNESTKMGRKKPKRKKNFWKTFFEFLHFKRKKNISPFSKKFAGTDSGK